MLRKMILAHILLSLAIPIAISANVPEAPAQLSAAQIVERNVACPWRLASLAGGADHVLLRQNGRGRKAKRTTPFVMEMKRPRKTRVEIESPRTRPCRYTTERTAEVAPFLGRREVEPFTIDEVKSRFHGVRLGRAAGRLCVQGHSSGR